jgi:hypothetical protein
VTSVATRAQTGLPDALTAEGPNREHTDALMLFGQFVGEWELDWAAYDDDGQEVSTERGEWIFGWVLEGRAVQDVWIIPERGRRGRADLPEGEYGTTIRFYDPRLDAWLVTWSGPIGRARRTLLARRAGDQILQEGQTEDGQPLRWIFSDISPDSFTWTSVYSLDGEQTWQLREQMHVRRRPA